MSTLLVAPILVPMLAAGLTLAAWQSPRAQRRVGLAGSVALLAAGIALLVSVWNGGIQATAVSNWAAPFGITLVADLLSATLVVLVGVMGVGVALYAVEDISAEQHGLGFFTLYHVLLAGVCGAFLTGDLFNLYVWFEVLLMASFVLLTLGAAREQLEGAIKYVTLNLLSSAIFLAAAGLLYASARTLNMADLSVRLAALGHERPYLVGAIAMLFLTAFGIKASLFPLFFWLPASYATPPATVSAIFAGLMTKVGVYALIRAFTLVFPTTSYGYSILLILGVLSMLIGVLGAVSQMEIRRILAFHSISQVGYMVLGLGLLASPSEPARVLALASALVYMVHHSLVKGNLFLIGGMVAAQRGTYELKRLGGLAKAAPGLAVLFMLSALSLAGIPPLSGFWAKLSVVKAGLDAGQFLATTAALATGLLTLISMTKIWNEVFWKAPDGAGPVAMSSPGPFWRRRLAIGFFVVVTLAIGLAPGPFFELSRRAALQVLDRQGYVDAVNLQTTARSREAAAAPPIRGEFKEELSAKNARGAKAEWRENALDRLTRRVGRVLRGSSLLPLRTNTAARS